MRVLLVLQLFILVAVEVILANNRHERSLRSLFRTTTPTPLSKYPVWKVHKYSGIDLRPVRPEEHHYTSEEIEYNVHEPRESSGQAPSLVEVSDLGANSEAFDELAASNQQGQNNDSADTQQALTALDNLAPLASLLPNGVGQAGRDGILSFVGLGRSAQNAQDKIGIVGGLAAGSIIKKKKKQIIGLAALANLLKLSSSAKIKKPANLQDLINGIYESISSPGSVYPVKNTVYRDIPASYPSAPSLLSRLPIIGSRFSPPGTQIRLPEPVLPEIPSLKLVPEAPKLPRLYLPGPYSVPYSSGSYVSIKVPTPPQIQTLLSPSPTTEAPIPSYGIPLETPHKVYGTPNEMIYPSQKEPVYNPYSQQEPVQQYAPPSQQYGPPIKEYKPPQQQYGVPAQEYQPPQQQYGVPAQEYQPPQQQYGVPAQEYQPPQQQYGVPAQEYQPPQQQYGVPAQEYQPPQQQYGVPAQEYQPPQQQYGVPAQEYQPPQQQYSQPAPDYQQPQQYSAPSQQYSAPSYHQAQKKTYQEEAPFLGIDLGSTNGKQGKNETVTGPDENQATN